MKISRLSLLVGVLFASLILAGCPHQAPVHNVDASLVTSSEEPKLKEISRAIRVAGAGLGWEMKEISTGHILGTLHLRKHIAKVDITFDSKTVKIQYKDSVNLRYKSDDQTIHSNYNGWIQNLEKAIMASTSEL